MPETINEVAFCTIKPIERLVEYRPLTLFEDK